MFTSRKQIRWTVRIASALCALFFMHLYSSSVKEPHKLLKTSGNSGRQLQGWTVGNQHHLEGELRADDLVHAPLHGVNRRLLSYSNGSHDNGGGGDSDNCTAPRTPHPGYDDSCSFVLQECGDEVQLINYMAFILCGHSNGWKRYWQTITTNTPDLRR